MKVALATCVKLPEHDADEAPLAAALRAAGAEVRRLAWDDPTATPIAGELVVIRSTWNYFDDVDGFLAWVDRTAKAARLFNPAPIVAGNAHKTYLRELEQRGIAIIETEFVPRGCARSLRGLMRERGWTAVVVKPAVSAGSFSTQRFDAGQEDDGQRFLDALTARRDAMVQRWMPSVEGYGERSLVWIDGDVTHAVRKSPRLLGATEGVTAASIAPDERAFAERVLAPIAKALLYARVDVVRDDGGTLRLMELELIEPSLFLGQSEHALECLTGAIVRRATGDLA
ncbi:MAG: hypothetical protein KF894_33130 [Labilithrix sp.]|nr:hypothetical protein [Labilithrix sp.]